MKSIMKITDQPPSQNPVKLDDEFLSLLSRWKKEQESPSTSKPILCGTLLLQASRIESKSGSEQKQPIFCDDETRILWETRHSRYDENAGWFTQLLQRFRNYICRIVE